MKPNKTQAGAGLSYLETREILHETKHLWVNRAFEVCAHAGTHSVSLGKCRDLNHAIRVAGKLERYPANLTGYVRRIKESA